MELRRGVKSRGGLLRVAGSARCWRRWFDGWAACGARGWRGGDRAEGFAAVPANGQASAELGVDVPRRRWGGSGGGILKAGGGACIPKSRSGAVPLSRGGAAAATTVRNNLFTAFCRRQPNDGAVPRNVTLSAPTRAHARRYAAQLGALEPRLQPVSSAIPGPARHPGAASARPAWPWSSRCAAKWPSAVGLVTWRCSMWQRRWLAGRGAGGGGPGGRSPCSGWVAYRGLGKAMFIRQVAPRSEHTQSTVGRAARVENLAPKPQGGWCLAGVFSVGRPSA